MGGFIRGLMGKKTKTPVITSTPPSPVVQPPIITSPPIIVITSYLMDLLGNVLTDNSGNRLTAV
jgi:hypothetical protein